MFVILVNFIALRKSFAIIALHFIDILTKQSINKRLISINKLFWRNGSNQRILCNVTP